MRIEVHMLPFGTFTFPQATADVVDDNGTLIVEVPNRPAWRVSFYRGGWRVAECSSEDGVLPYQIDPPVVTR